MQSSEDKVLFKTCGNLKDAMMQYNMIEDGILMCAQKLTK